MGTNDQDSTAQFLLSNLEAFASTGCSWCSSTLCASFIHWNNHVRLPRFAKPATTTAKNGCFLPSRGQQKHNWQSVLRSPNILSEHSTPFSLNPTNLALIRQVWKGSFFVSSSSFFSPNGFSRWTLLRQTLRAPDRDGPDTELLCAPPQYLTSLRGWKLHGEERNKTPLGMC